MEEKRLSTRLTTTVADQREPKKYKKKKGN
jgi:hypothetical protein